MPIDLYIGYLNIDDVDIERIVQSIFDLERTFNNEKDSLDNLYSAIRRGNRICRSKRNISMGSE